jgi:C1A family cysteine protease
MMFSTGNSSTQVPRVVDWGNVNGGSLLPEVRDQGNCGSCVAFATCAVLEARMKIAKNDPNFRCNLSAAQLFFCGVGADACDQGWQIGSALAFCRDNGGIGAEEAFPYDLAHRECSEDKKSIPPIVTVEKWRKISESGPRFDVIREQGPVIGAMVVYSDFLWYANGVYRPTTNEVIGRHAIAVVGYDMVNGAWIVQNSWGPGWGDKGIGRIGFGTCGIDHEFPFYDVKIRIL